MELVPGATQPPPATNTGQAVAEGAACMELVPGATQPPPATNTGQAVAEGAACMELVPGATQPPHTTNTGQAVANVFVGPGLAPGAAQPPANSVEAVAGGAVSSLGLTASAAGPLPTNAGQAVAEGTATPGLVDSGSSAYCRHALTVTRLQAVSREAESYTPAVRAEARLLLDMWRLHTPSWPPAALRLPEGCMQVRAQVGGAYSCVHFGAVSAFKSRCHTCTGGGGHESWPSTAPCMQPHTCYSLMHAAIYLLQPHACSHSQPCGYEALVFTVCDLCGIFNYGIIAVRMS